MATSEPALEIDVETLRSRLERGEALTVLDVRPAPQRAEWRIPGSLHEDAYDALWDGDPRALAGVALPAGVPVVTVCARGRTSLIAAQRLRERGVEAFSLAGGMHAWSLAWNAADVAVPGSPATVVQVRRTGKGCLSYVVGAGGVAAVIDPSVAPEVYLAIARARRWKIVEVLDTHVHADHLSRARALAAATGAALRLPEQQRVKYPHLALRDGDEVALGPSRLRALRTPGHTPESTCYLLDGRALFSGDTVFLAAVGRPDLAAASDEAARGRARALHASVARVRALPDETLILPCHASEPVLFVGTPVVAPLAEVRARLAALDVAEEKFVEAVLARLPPCPANHAAIVRLNETGEAPAGEPADLEAGANRCAAG
jgi:glyoxylase-like metal-dependent hydrolase (beta-lactamase superfamily II)